MKSLLSILADVANGVFATLMASYVTGVDPSWHFVLGIALAMAPDLDALPELVRRGKVAASSMHAHDHREALHFPLLFLGMSIGLILVTPFFGWLFFFATMLHFVNDLYGTGWGIPVLWPLSNRRFKVLGRRANLLKSILIEKGLWDGVTAEDQKLRLLVTWTHEELPVYIRKFGIEDWIQCYYLRRNWVSFVEYGLFMIAVILLWRALV